MRLITFVFFTIFVSCTGSNINIPQTCNISNKQECISNAFCDEHKLQGLKCILGLYDEALVYEEKGDRLILNSLIHSAAFEYRHSLTLLKATKENLKNLLLADFNVFKYNQNTSLMNKIELKLSAIVGKLSRCNRGL
jgi:hypothetical protein